MAGIKWFYNLMETVILGFWSLTIIDLIPMFGLGMLSDVDSTIKTGMAAVGGIYLVVQLPFKILELWHKRKMNKLERQIKSEELEKIKKENDSTH